jgi:hypothetical protein
LLIYGKLIFFDLAKELFCQLLCNYDMLILINKSVKYLNENPHIILLDCTYKTNKFGMPMLNILGVNGLDQGFTVRVAFLNTKTKEDYN